jgi:hypothetical protein
MPQDLFPQLEPGDALITPGFASTIEECYLGKVPGFTHMVDLCRLLEILLSHNRVFVPRTASYWLATDLGGTRSILSQLAGAGIVKFFYPCSRLLGRTYRDGLLAMGAGPEALWSPEAASQRGNSPPPQGPGLERDERVAARALFGLCGAEGLPKSEWDSAYFPLAQAALTPRTPDNVAFSIWGNTFGFSKRSMFEGPKLCFNQGFIAAMPPAELESELESGRLRMDEAGRLLCDGVSFTPPETCIEQIKHYWRFIDETRRIASRHGAVLHHAFMETPYVQLKETEFDKVDGSSAREAIHLNVSVSDDFRQVYSRWVVGYRSQCFGTETVSVPPLAQLVLAGTECQLDETVYEFRDPNQHAFRTVMRDRKLHRLHEGVVKTRKRLEAFRKINTEAMVDIAALRVAGRADLGRYARAKGRFVAALKESSEEKGAVRRIFSLSNATDFLGQTLLGNYPSALLAVAKKLAEFLPMSNELHFGNASTLSPIADVLEDPVRSFRDVFGELSCLAEDDIPFFLGQAPADATTAGRPR